MGMPRCQTCDCAVLSYGVLVEDKWMCARCAGRELGRLRLENERLHWRLGYCEGGHLLESNKARQELERYRERVTKLEADRANFGAQVELFCRETAPDDPSGRGNNG